MALLFTIMIFSLRKASYHNSWPWNIMSIFHVSGPLAVTYARQTSKPIISFSWEFETDSHRSESFWCQDPRNNMSSLEPLKYMPSLQPGHALFMSIWDAVWWSGWEQGAKSQAVWVWILDLSLTKLWSWEDYITFQYSCLLIYERHIIAVNTLQSPWESEIR